MTWIAARKKCHDFHPRSHPVVINDVDEQNLIMKYLNSIKRGKVFGPVIISVPYTIISFMGMTLDSDSR